MVYYLGIDAGTSFSTAAICRDNTDATFVQLTAHTVSIPSVLFLNHDDDLVVGVEAEKLGAIEPERLVRHFVRRFGEQAAIFVGGSPFSVQALIARLLSWVVDAVAEQEGERPAGVAITLATSWGQYKQETFRQALRLAEISSAALVPDHTCTALAYAARVTLAQDACIAVYDLGGGAFDAAVLRHRDGEFELLGTAESIEPLGGTDFDDALIQRAQLGVRERLTTATSAELLRRDCVRVKELLSSEELASIRLGDGTATIEVPVTRSDFEAIIRPPLIDTIKAMRRVLQAGDVRPTQLSAILMTGGSARIPLVRQLMATAFHAPLAFETGLSQSAALGASLAARRLAAPPNARETSDQAEVPAGGPHRRRGLLVLACCTFRSGTRSQRLVLYDGQP